MEAPHAHNLLFIVVFRPGEVCPSCGWFKPRLIFPLHHLFALSVFVPANVSPALWNQPLSTPKWWNGINLPADAFTCLRHVSILVTLANVISEKQTSPFPRQSWS